MFTLEFVLKSLSEGKLMSRWKENLNDLVPLEYVKFLKVPMKDTKYGPVIDLPPNTLETMAAKSILLERIPLRGKEVQFFRKTLGLSLEKFSAKLSLSSGTVFHWEKAMNERLAPVNEAAVRTLLAEEFDVELPAKFSLLLGTKIQNLEIKAS